MRPPVELVLYSVENPRRASYERRGHERTDDSRAVAMNILALAPLVEGDWQRHRHLCEHQLDAANIEQFVEAAWVAFIFVRNLLEKVAEAVTEVEKDRRTGIMCDLNLVKTGFIVAFERGPAIPSFVCDLVQANVERCYSRKW